MAYLNPSIRLRPSRSLRKPMWDRRAFQAESALRSGARVLTYTTREVIDKRISVPAQHSLVRLSKKPDTSAAAVAMLEAVKTGRLAGIHCANWETPARRALGFGRTWWMLIPPGEDAALILDPNNPAAGQPLIAFRRELDPDCGLLKGEKRFAAAPSRLDSALLKAWASYKTWETGRQPGQTIRCTLRSTNGPSGTTRQALQSGRTLANVVPPVLCQIVQQVPPTPAPLCLVGPCLTHFRGPNRLTPERMNPGFIDAQTDTIRKSPQLQAALDQLLDSRYKTLKPRIAVAVVNLTGDQKLAAPELAGWRETVQIFGASVPKIAPLYAVFQLQHDLHILARLNSRAPVTTKADLIRLARQRWEQEGLRVESQPRIEELFDFVEAPPAPVTIGISSGLKDLLCCAFRFSCNRTASILIDKVGFPFLSSALWQSGLFHRTRGGLWLQRHYGIRKDCFEESCSIPCNDVFGRATMTSSPVRIPQRVIRGFRPPRFSPQNATALSTATYFTLMAQGRLITSGASRRIEQELAQACTFFAADQDPTSDRTCRTRGFGNSALVLTSSAQKCGFNPRPLVAHDCILVTRQIGGKRLRYVVVLLTENASVRGRSIMRQQAVCFFRNDFLVEVDNMIQRTNP